MFKKISREPLVHFLFAGFLLFVYFKSCSTESFSENTIVINKEELLNFMQFQSKAFNAKVFEEKLAQFSDAEKQQLLDNYTKDEVLYRAAIELGLDQNDFVIKRRIIQKMEFILDDFDASTAVISEDSVQAYFLQNQQRYFQAAQYSFTHIFFHKDKNGLERAKAFVKTPAHQQLAAAESLPYGDRFLYHRNYTEKTTSFLDSQFGKTFIHTLATMKADEKNWQGPIESEHGQHLIKLLDKKEAAVPKFVTIQSTVQSDYLNELKNQYKAQQIQKLMEKYQVVIDLE